MIIIIDIKGNIDCGLHECAKYHEKDDSVLSLSR